MPQASAVCHGSPSTRPAHLPQQRRTKLEPHQEQHHDDAELGEVHHVLAFAADQTEAERTDRGTGDQVTEHRAEPQALGQRH
jgi:hypothetical protein